jgi:hypothetical protein
LHATERTRRPSLNAIDMFAKYDFDTELLELILQSLAELGLERLADKNVAGMDERDALLPFEIRGNFASIFNLKSPNASVRLEGHQHCELSPRLRTPTGPPPTIRIDVAPATSFCAWTRAAFASSIEVAPGGGRQGKL